MTSPDLDPITLTIRLFGETRVTVDRAAYERAKLDGEVDTFLDVDLSNLDGTNTVTEPDGRTFDPVDNPHGPTEPPRDPEPFDRCGDPHDCTCDHGCDIP